MARSRISAAVREIPLEAARLARGDYPDFVLARRPAPLDREVPVFMFHDLKVKRFRSQLSYLSENGYRTLTAAEFMAFLKGDLKLQGPSVLLTFDDGRKSWARTAFALLKEHGYTAVGFLVTSFINEQAVPGSPWLSWTDVRRIDRVGTISFESHTAFHDRVFVSPRVIDFLHPGSFTDPLGLNAPWADSEDGYTNRLLPGSPVYRYAPRLAGLPRWLDDQSVRKACSGWVEAHGGEAFFRRRGWRRELRKVVAAAGGGNASGARFETDEEQRGAILKGLITARVTLEEKLNREATHLSYPWGVGSELAVTLSQEAGYESAFSVTGPRNISRPGDSPWYVPRLKDDYIFRLPGRGRKSLGAVFAHKLRRRARAATIY